MEKENLSKSGQEITRSDTCSFFSGRKSILAIEPICWFCKYADFDLKSDKLPERGTCCYPVEQKEWKKGGNTYTGTLTFTIAVNTAEDTE